MFDLLTQMDLDYIMTSQQLWGCRAGLEGDDISSTVAVAGLKADPKDPRAGIFAAACASRTALILPLRFLEHKSRWAPVPQVYVLENPTVFSAILDASAGEEPPPLVCSSGQPSVAVLRLLDELTASGIVIRYSGDFDWEGLQIGVRLAERYGTQFQHWLFDTPTYLTAPPGTVLLREQLLRLAELTVLWDQNLVSALCRRGVTVYQEALVEKMLAALYHNGGCCSLRPNSNAAASANV